MNIPEIEHQGGIFLVTVPLFSTSPDAEKLKQWIEENIKEYSDSTNGNFRYYQLTIDNAKAMLDYIYSEWKYK